MAFIKVENVVINTNYIAAVRLEGRNADGEEVVSLLITISASSLFHSEQQPTDCNYYEWFEFTGAAAIALRDYFTSYNNVIDLLPHPPQGNTVEFRGKRSIRTPR
jgi:hypothetical protein